MKKLAAVTLFLIAATSLTAANSLETTFYEKNTTATPGQDTEIGTLEIYANNTTATNLEASINFQFDTSLTNPSKQSLTNNSRYNITLTASPEKTFRPGNYTRDLFVTGDQYQVKQRIDVEVPKVINWTTVSNQMSSNVSVGSGGSFGNTTVYSTGNTPVEVKKNLSGNISEYVDAGADFTLYPDINETLRVEYDVNREVPFGFYNGTLELAGGELNETIRLSSVFVDEITPEISSVSVPDVMSTKSTGFRVSASDNLAVANLTGKVFRSVEVVEGNTTVQRNRTLGTYSFNQKPNTDQWNIQFNDTDEIDEYWINITAKDQSGNTAHQLEQFNVEGLDAIKVKENNFKFETVYPKDVSNVLGEKVSKASKPILELEQQTDVTLTLESFSHGNQNSSISIGVLKPGNEVKTNFDIDQDNPQIEFSKTGEYSLVVESDSVEDYSGEISINHVPQHVPIAQTIEFEGLVNQPEYPPEQEWTLRGWDASLEYLDTDDDPQPDKLRRVLEGPADTCKGYSTAEKCPEITDFSEIVDKVKKENEQVRSTNTAIIVIASTIVLAAVSFAALISRRYAARSILTVESVKDEHYNELFEDDELKELGVIE